MPFIKTEIEDLFIFEPTIFKDERGYFFESYNKKNFTNQSLSLEFVQDNQSFSTYGVVRGLHFQTGEFEQAKLVRVLQGKIFDVAVDIRKNSPTYKKWIGVELSAENKRQLFIPRGFAHGFSVLSETTEILYKCDNFYHKQSEGGIIFNDPQLNIDWKIPPHQIKVSEKDFLLPLLSQS